MLDTLTQVRHSVELSETLKRSVSSVAEKSERANKPRWASSAKSTFLSNCTLLQAQIEEFEKLVSQPQPLSQNPQTYASSTNQRVPASKLVKPSAKGETDSAVAIADAISKLRSRKQFPDLRSSPLGLFVEDGMRSMDKITTLLQDVPLNSQTWSKLPDNLLQLLGDSVDQPSVTSQAEEMQEQLKRMSFNAEEITQQQQEAVAEGDMKKMETLYFKRVTMQEAMVDVFNKLFEVLDTHHSEYFTKPLKRVHQVHKEANAQVASLMKEQEDLKTAVEGDMESLKSATTSVRESDETATMQFRHIMKENSEAMQENQRQHEQVLSAIEELERELGKLGKERSEIVGRRIALVEQERRRRAEVQGFDSFVKAQLQLLENTLSTCEVAEEVTDSFDEMICNGCNAVEQYMRTVDEDIEKERIAAHELRLTHFRELYLTLGDLQYKKERNLDELDKKIQHATVQQEIAMETFNPKAKEIANMKKDLMAVREEMESQVQVLQDKSTLHIEAFKPTEVALIKYGKDFVHPVDELNSRNEARQQKLIEYHQLMSTENEGEYDAEEELRAIEEERKRIQPRQPVQLSPHGSPTKSQRSPTKSLD